MSISTVELNSPESVWVDRGGKTLGYFCQKKPVRVDRALIKQLVANSRELGGKDLRLCLHESPDSDFHEMIILQYKDRFYRPHKHLKKGESYHSLLGELGALAFDHEGKVIDSCRLSAGGENLIYRVGTDMYHGVVPLSEIVVYHETKPGPFITPGDSVFPAWAPEPADEVKAHAYMQTLQKVFA